MNTQSAYLSRPERLFVLVSLLFMLGALRPLYTGLGTVWGFDHGAGNTTFQGISASIYLVAFVLLLLHFQRAAVLALKNKWLIIFVIFTVISSTWALAPDVSLRRSVALCGTTIYAFYLATRIHPKDLFELLTWAFIIFLVENFVIIGLMPHIGVSSYPHTGAWRGVLGHKNEFGRIMLLGALVLWLASQRSLASKPWSLAGMALCLVLVVFSQSRTAWVTFFLLAMSIPFLQFLRRPEIPLLVRFVLVCVGLVGTAVVLIASIDLVLTLLERDATLTDRTRIWATAFEVGKERLWHGYGYRSFWLGVEGLTRYLHGHGHNSYLDMWLEMGLVGLTIFLITLAILIRRAFFRLANSQDVLGLWYMIFIIYIVLFCMTSKVLPDQGTITWVLYVTGLLYLSPVPAEAPTTAPQRVMAASRSHV